MLEVSLSLRRRFLVPEEFRLLVAGPPVRRRRLVCPEAEAEVRVTVTLVGGGLGDKRSLKCKKDRKRCMTKKKNQSNLMKLFCSS